MKKKKLCNVSDIAVGQMKSYTLDDTAFVIVHTGENEWYALDGKCTHKGATLAEGQIVDEYIIECPWHGARFDMRTGKVKSLPAVEPLKTYDIEIVEDEVMIELHGCMNKESDSCCGGACGCSDDV